LKEVYQSKNKKGVKENFNLEEFEKHFQSQCGKLERKLK
jgi:hypothetical protein